jgi:hypothetical protein
MQRYRGSAPQPAGKGGEVSPPLPPPRPAPDTAASPAASQPAQAPSWTSPTGSGTGWSSGSAATTYGPGTAAPGASPATAAPSAAQTTPESPAVSTATKAAPPAKPTLSSEQTGEFKKRWREVQGDFVDDPQQAVRSAHELARGVLDALTDKIADMKRVEAWKAGEGSGTEDLRLSLRQYRKLVDRLLEL